MSQALENPMGLDGFEFVEFSAPSEGQLEEVFKVLGFQNVATHRSKNVDLWRQGDVNFIVNYEPRSVAGACVPAMFWSVRWTAAAAA